MSDGALYPPSLRKPPRLVDTSTTYRIRVVLVLCSLLVFLAVYLGLLAGSAWLVRACWSIGRDEPAGPRAYRSHRESGGLVVWRFLFTAGAVMLFLFLLKGLFKRTRSSTDHWLRVHEPDAPGLFAFVRSLCEETGAPFPRRIYLSHDVNAAVFYPRSLLSLVLPVRKNLLVGLGTVEALTLSEMKAVLAHEFGHFAQSSMKLGQYVYVANQVMFDIIHSRDRWDDALAVWRAIDIRISFPAWILTAVVWLLRKLLGLLFQAINLLNLSLSRQMEFDADLQAVRLTGSDALISALWKLERASLAQQMALSQLRAMSDHGAWSDDLYLHQRREHARVPELLTDEARRDDAARPLHAEYLPGRKVCFAHSDEERSTPWHTHPPHHAREVNAKRVYVAHEQDDRSAWLLFEPAAGVRAAVTRLAYQEMVGKAPQPGQQSPASEVQARIEEERAEVEQGKHYHGLWDDRVIQPGDVVAMAAKLDALRAAGRDDGPELRRAAATFAAAVPELVSSWKARQKEGSALRQAVEGREGPVQVEHRGQKLNRTRARRALEEVSRELGEMGRRLADGEQALFRWCYWRAASVGMQGELLERYRFLLLIQARIVEHNQIEGRLVPVLALLQSGQELDAGAVAYALSIFRSGHAVLERTLDVCRDIRLPRLSHLQPGAPVASFVLPQGKVLALFPGDNVAGTWIGEFCQQFFGALERLRRLHFKNLGALLRLQEELDPTLFPREAG